eukprot:1317246-Amorphochlora_amoeboformis.AAC.1
MGMRQVALLLLLAVLGQASDPRESISTEKPPKKSFPSSNEGLAMGNIPSEEGFHSFVEFKSESKAATPIIGTDLLHVPVNGNPMAGYYAPYA